MAHLGLGSVKRLDGYPWLTPLFHRTTRIHTPVRRGPVPKLGLDCRDHPVTTQGSTLAKSFKWRDSRDRSRGGYPLGLGYYLVLFATCRLLVTLKTPDTLLAAISAMFLS